MRTGDRSQCLRFAGSIFKGPLTFEGPWPRQVSRCMSLVDLKDPRPEKKNERRTIWPDLPYFFLILFSPTCLLVRITFICENRFSLYLFPFLSLICLVKFFSQGPLITHLDAGRRNRAKVGGEKE